MGGIATGFSTIALVIAAGWFAQRVGIVGPSAREMLIRLAYFLAAPALLVGVVADADLGELLQLPLLVQVVATAGAALAFVAVDRLWLRLRPPEGVVGVYSSSYINAANIGIPVSVYVLGDAAASVPVILLQVLVLGPLAISLLDLLTAGRPSWRTVLTQPVRNPVILASAVGAVLALTGWHLPTVVESPLRLLGGAAIPMQLLAFGMSLHGLRLFGPGSTRAAASVAAAIKVVVMPLLAFLVARFVVRADDEFVFTAVVLAGLPVAQNVYNYSARFGRGDDLARDAILLSTLAAPVTLMIAAALLR